MLRSFKGLVASLIPYWSNEPNYELIHGTNSGSHSPTSSTHYKEDVFSQIGVYFTKSIFFLIPSPIQRRLQPAHFKPQRLYATSYLDGLRGVASLIVFFCHFTEENVFWFTNSYGLPEDDPVQSSFLQLPFVRVLYSGRPMVHIFFVISGFVLSLKALKLARSHNWASLHATLSSSVFRRGMRLFLPTTASTFMVMVLVYKGWLRMKDGLKGQQLDTFYLQFQDWLDALWIIGYSWKWDELQWPPYDVHVWTIPVEMANSMLLFVSIIGLSRCKVWVRLTMTVVLMAYSLKCGHWAAFEFLGGALVAEIGLIQTARAEREANKEMPLEEDPPTSWKTRASYAFWTANVIFALWIAGWPNYNVKNTTGLRLVEPYTMEPFYSKKSIHEQAYSWFALGAMQIVFACQQMPFLQRVFTTGPAQYLANISYALYLMHGPVLGVFQHRWMPYVWWALNSSETTTMWTRTLGWLGGVIGLSIPVFWAADIFWRLVDTPSVEFAKWLEGKCVVKED